MAGGRKKLWDELKMSSRLNLIEHWARNGMIEADMMKNLGVSKDTFYLWKKEKPEFYDALQRGKEVADALVESALFKSALGYEVEEVTEEPTVVRAYGDIVYDDEGNPVTKLVVTKRVTKQVAPAVAAQIFWMKNRQPERWRDKQEIKHTGGPVMFVNDLPPDEE